MSTERTPLNPLDTRIWTDPQKPLRYIVIVVVILVAMEIRLSLPEKTVPEDSHQSSSEGPKEPRDFFLVWSDRTKRRRVPGVFSLPTNPQDPV